MQAIRSGAFGEDGDPFIVNSMRKLLEFGACWVAEVLPFKMITDEIDRPEEPSDFAFEANIYS